MVLARLFGGNYMAYFAHINNQNVVTDVIRIVNEICGEPTLQFPETESAGQAFIANTLKLNGTWLQTSYNANFRGKYAAIGDVFDGTNFVTPKESE